MNVWKGWTVASSALLLAAVANCGGSPPANAPSVGGGGQPNMETARRELKQARAYLERAEHDKGGHRARAVELTDRAIVEVDQGIAFAE